MANYKDIKGTTVEVKSATLPTSPYPQAEGGLYYNLGNGDYQFLGTGVGAWATGANLNTTRNDLDGSGTLTAGLAFGGNPNKAVTEEYDGSSWTESGDLNTARRALTGFGLQTATIAAGGSEGPYNNEVEQYDGSSWTEIAEINTAGGGSPGSCGTTTAGLVFGRRKLPGATKGGETETWNGSSWTEVGDLNTARFSVGGLGTQTAALAVSGAPPHYANVEQWNGSAWTEVADINSARSAGGASGTTTSALYFVGEDGTGVRNLTESWNGSAWTEIADASAGAGKVADSDSSSTAAFFAGGDGPPGGAVNTTEEWSFSHTIKTITTS